MSELNFSIMKGPLSNVKFSLRSLEIKDEKKTSVVDIGDKNEAVLEEFGMPLRLGERIVAVRVDVSKYLWPQELQFYLFDFL